MDASDANTDDTLTFSVSGGLDAERFELTQGNVPGQAVVQRVSSIAPYVYRDFTMLQFHTGTSSKNLTVSIDNSFAGHEPYSAVNPDYPNSIEGHVDGSNAETLVEGLNALFSDNGLKSVFFRSRCKRRDCTNH